MAFVKYVPNSEKEFRDLMPYSIKLTTKHMDKRVEMLTWCDRNCKKDEVGRKFCFTYYKLSHDEFIFRFEEDAIAFKLRWF